MEVGEQHVHHLELMAGGDVDAGAAFPFTEPRIGPCGLERAHHGRPHREDRPTLPSGGVHEGFCRSRYGEDFLVHGMLLDLAGPDGQKSAKTNVKRHPRGPYAASPQFIEHPARKVKACRGSCRGAHGPGVDRLVPFVIRGSIGPPDVGRQGDMTIAFPATHRPRENRNAPGASRRSPPLPCR